MTPRYAEFPQGTVHPPNFRKILNIFQKHTTFAGCRAKSCAVFKMGLYENKRIGVPFSAAGNSRGRNSRILGNVNK